VRYALALLGWLSLLLSGGPGRAAPPARPAASRTQYSFNPEWRVLVGDPAGAEKADFADKSWKRVTLPYAWNEDEAFKKDIKDLSTGVAWYRKHFRLPTGAAGQKVFIEFEGVRQLGEFYLNGQALVRHENGVMAVGFDLTPYLRPTPADNVLAVRTDNDWDYQEKATGQGYQFLFTFPKVAWQPGTLPAVSYDAKGQKASTAEHQTAGPTAALRLVLTTSPAGLHADGTDLALVQVEAVDAQGRRCPTALNMVDFALSGPAEWRGGLAQGPDSYILAKSLPIKGGANRVLIRTTTQAGKITPTATAEGLKPATVSLQSLPVQVEAGLATRLPSTDLLARLERGPTPARPSFTKSRVSVPITDVAANSSAANAALSYDDNELSEWGSDCKEPKPWIEYTLARPAGISEVAMKLTGWRTSTYPIRILVDGQEAFRGTTESSLGYHTATFAPRTGQKVRIELTSAGQAKDAFNITELEVPKVPAAATDQPGLRGTLGLVEVEFYEKAAGAPAL
jgi:hypothetical protein